jgi:ribonuclease HI
MERTGLLVLTHHPEDSEVSGRRLTHLSDVQLASIFVPQDPNLPPEAHFPLQTVFSPGRPPYPRFVNRFDSREMLLVVDGSCVNNGRHANKLQDPVAGCSFTFKGTPGIMTLDDGLGTTTTTTTTTTPTTFPFLAGTGTGTTGTTATEGTQQQEVSGSIAFRLEREGPLGNPVEHTSNRAKLRAVIAALQFRAWGGEGWRRVVVLTDLECVVLGATTWLSRWVRRQWRKKRGGGPYLNRDLWEELHHCIVELRDQGCDVSFWLVTRDRASRFIAHAKAAAQGAARSHPEAQADKFTTMCGVML